jgi:hypothetical protein
VMWVKWKVASVHLEMVLISASDSVSVHLELVLILAQNSCIVCIKCTTGIELFLVTPDGTPR